jgi:acetyl esterase/lipase
VAGTRFDRGNPSAADPIDRESSRPDFLVLAYGAYGDDIHVTAETPPSFLVHASDDGHSAADSAHFYIDLKKAGVPGELHIYTRGGHGFGIQNRSMPISGWPRLLQEWLADRGLLKPH